MSQYFIQMENLLLCDFEDKIMEEFLYKWIYTLGKGLRLLFKFNKWGSVHAQLVIDWYIIFWHMKWNDGKLYFIYHWFLKYFVMILFRNAMDVIPQLF